AAAVAGIGSCQPPMRLNETTRAFFAGLARVSPPDQARLFTNLADPAVQEALRASNVLYNSMLRTSVVPTIIKGGFRENVIPAEAEAILDVRALPDEDIDRLMATLKSLVNDPAVEITRRTEGQRRPAAPASGLHTEMFAALERAQTRMFPEAITVPVMSTGATDGAQLRAKGVQTYGIEVPMPAEDRVRMHGNDERVSLDALGRFTDYLYAVVVDVAGRR